MKTNRPCNYCTKDYEAETRYLRRGQGLYCGHSCAAKGNASKRPKPEPNVQCYQCSKVFYRNKSKQSVSKSGLQFCSRQCKEYAQSLEGGVVEIQPAHYNTGTGESTYRVRALRMYPSVCMRCDWDEVPVLLQVHHRDHNRKNNDPTNWEILCPYCHAMHHWGPKD